MLLKICSLHKIILHYTIICKILPPIFSHMGKYPYQYTFLLHIVITKGDGGVNLMSGTAGYGGGFAFVVVLFILLIIVGSAYGGYGYY
ncbi:hypothetical protein GCM10028868_07740 [Virgibacillus kimchii]